MSKRIDSLPDVLECEDGTRVITKELWQQKRRPELLDLFREHVYGWEPVQRPKNLHFNTIAKDHMMRGKAIRKKIHITFQGPGGEGRIQPTIFIPAGVKKPVPVFLLINHSDSKNADSDRYKKTPFWPAEMIISRGYAAAVFQCEDLDPDFHDGFKNGVHPIFDSINQPRPSNAWGTISAWAWGASRVMDYFETDPDIDSKRVAIVGHSRGGKTALWAGALDQRFAMVVSNNSGCTGAAVSRGKRGETIRNINEAFPHWFCDNYKEYNDREGDLPVDQHMLLSLIAPRPLYVASASEDEWCDPESEFFSLLQAEPVYQLYGITGLDEEKFPEINTPIHEDKMGYHLRDGDHGLLKYDWECYLDFFDKFGGKRGV